MSKHVFTIEAKFDTSEEYDALEYDAFVDSVSSAGGDIVDEESDF